jgi:hypothetical protein
MSDLYCGNAPMPSLPYQNVARFSPADLEAAVNEFRCRERVWPGREPFDDIVAFKKPMAHSTAKR